QSLYRLSQVDLVPVDLDAVLRLERRRDVLVGDRAEGLVLGTHLEAHDHGFVVDLVGDRLRLVALLGLLLDGSLAQPLRLRLRAPTRGHGQLARQEEVAAVAVGHLLHIAGVADVLDVLRQQDPHFTRPPTLIGTRRVGGLAKVFDRTNASPRAWRSTQYR